MRRTLVMLALLAAGCKAAEKPTEIDKQRAGLELARKAGSPYEICGAWRLLEAAYLQSGDKQHYEEGRLETDKACRQADAFSHRDSTARR